MSEVNVQFPEIFRPLLTSKARYKVMVGGRGSAKCLSPGTKVIMYDGSTKSVEDIKLGDLLIGPDSSPRKVLSTVHGYDEMFKISQRNAMTYVVTSDHLLAFKKSKSSLHDNTRCSSGNLRRPNGRYPQYGEIAFITAQEYSIKSKRFKEHFHGFKCSMLEFPSNDIKIDPYFLGLWLGDGTSCRPDITTMDSEISEYVFSYANSFENTAVRTLKISSSNLTKQNKARTYSVVGLTWHNNPLLNLLKYYDLINNKHIPDDYLKNSSRVRLKLLAGLLDTDGYMKNGCYEIIQKNKRLAYQIKYVADTLGFVTNIREINSSCQTGAKGVYHKLSIYGDVYKIPCKLPRKVVKESDTRKNKDFRKTHVESINIGQGEYYGFELDGDHLFCLEDGTVTHNSWSAARAALIKAVSGRIRVLCCREIQSSIRESVHKLLSDSIADMGLSNMFTINEREIKCHVTGSEFIFEGLFRNATRVKSLESIDLCWIEEGQTISEASLELLMPTVRNEESEIWVCFNPAYETDPIWKRFMVNPPDNAIIIKAGWQDNPWFPDVLKKEMEDDYAYRPEAAKNIWGGELKRSGSFVWVPPYDRSLHVKEFNLKDVGEYKCFQSLDPHTAFYSFSIWAARWKQGDRFYTWVYDEYPTHADVGDDYVNVRKKLHYTGTVADLARTFFAKEGSTKITSRFIDSRFCKGFGGKQSNLVNTTEGLVQTFAKPDNGGILYLMPQERNIDAANDFIKKDFQYNKLAERSAINEPCLYISAKCKNLILALTNHRFAEDEEKEMEDYKDASDCLTILYAGLGEYRWPKKSSYDPGEGGSSWMA